MEIINLCKFFEDFRTHRPRKCESSHLFIPSSKFRSTVCPLRQRSVKVILRKIDMEVAGRKKINVTSHVRDHKPNRTRDFHIVTRLPDNDWGIQSLC